MIKKVKAPFRIDFAGGTTDISPFRDEMYGTVLNASINKYVVGYIKKSDKGIELKYSSNIPTASGLGTSGCMNVVLSSLITHETDKIKLAEQAFKIEQAIGDIGGKQDQYGASLGGINLLEFIKDKTKITPLNLSKYTVKELENHLILIYSGKSRLSKNTNRDVIESYKKNDQTTVNALKRIKQISYEMKNALEKSNFKKFISLMNEEWLNRKRLHKSITNPYLNKLIEEGLKYSLAAKVCGAAGGGCILFYAKNKNEFRTKMKKHFIIDFKFDFKGIQISES